MPRNRLLPLTLLLIGFIGACDRSSPPPAVLGRVNAGAAPIATFEGDYDPQTHTLSIRTAPAGNPNGIVAFPIWQDGNPGSGPDNTLELVTEQSPGPGPVSAGCGAGVDSYEGSITLRSFFRDQAFSQVYIEIQSITSGYEACNSVTTVPAGLSNFSGLWSYGTLGPSGGGANAVTRPWKFRFQSSGAFTFRGRIMANLGAPVAYGGPEFDWSPSVIVTPPSTFKEVGTTTAHIVWNGTTFADAARNITFVPSGSAPPHASVGLWDPAATYAGPFTGTSFYVADAAHGGGAVDTSGEFTACVKFKPGAQPVGQPSKIYFAKGQPEPSEALREGWALMQMHDMYCFHYRTPADARSGDVMSYVYPETGAPQAYAYDYICGGRVSAVHAGTATDVLHGGAHGRLIGLDMAETGTFTGNGASFPLVIGAYPDGSEPAWDGGVYEVILDSRPATLAVMNEIVGDAEGRRLFPGSASYSALYVPASAGAAGTTVIGADGGQYVVPVYGTVPLPADGSGLLPEGSIVEYTHPLAGDTRATGFCVGVEVVADGAWSNVHGGLLDFGSTELDLRTNPFAVTTARNYTFNQDDWSIESAWPPGSAHVFKACAEPYVAGPPLNKTRLYLDGAQVSSGDVTGTITDLSDPAARLQIGYGSWPPATLSGARIRRVFMCPTSTATGCN